MYEACVLFKPIYEFNFASKKNSICRHFVSKTEFIKIRQIEFS